MIVIANVDRLFKLPEFRKVLDGWQRTKLYPFSILMLGNWVSELEDIIRLINDIPDLDITFVAGPAEMKVLYGPSSTLRHRLIYFISVRQLHLIYSRFNFIFSYGSLKPEFLKTFISKDRELIANVNLNFIISIKDKFLREAFESDISPVNCMDAVELNEYFRNYERDELTRLLYPENDTKSATHRIYCSFVQYFPSKNTIKPEEGLYLVQHEMPLYKEKS